MYFSMKYIKGPTLAEQLQSGPLPPRKIALLLAKVCRAIDFAHQNGVLHRDLKPSNILIDEEGRTACHRFWPGQENHRSAQPDPVRRRDRDSGLHVAGTGGRQRGRGRTGQRRVQPGGDPVSHADRRTTVSGQFARGRGDEGHRTGSHCRHDNSIRNVDRDLEMIAVRCLQKPPDLRYASAGALADDLEAYLNNEPIAARSGRFTQVVSRWFRETHHATVLENWGLLWMWHSLALLVACLLTNILFWNGVSNRWYYFYLWTAGFGTWAAVFWALRHRQGPVTFVERQIAHVWAAALVSIIALFPLEAYLGLPLLKLSPVLGLIAGMVFLVKAGILSGLFYIQAAALFITAGLMAIWPSYEHLVFGVVSAACFFFPGLKYYRQQTDKRGQDRCRQDPADRR